MEVCTSPHLYCSWRVPGVVFPQWSEMTSETDMHWRDKIVTGKETTESRVVSYSFISWRGLPGEGYFELSVWNAGRLYEVSSWNPIRRLEQTIDVYFGLKLLVEFSENTINWDSQCAHTTRFFQKKVHSTFCLITIINSNNELALVKFERTRL